MKRYIYLMLLISFAVSSTSCNKNSSTTDELGEVGPVLKGISVEMAGMETGGKITLSAIADFVVNTANDPTREMTNRTSWELDIEIYKDSAPYAYGVATCTWNNGTQTWDPPVGANVCFPNYTKQLVAAKLHPAAWTDTVVFNQSLAADLLAQDILTQNGNATVTIHPSHTPTISMRHGNSMVDFILSEVDETHIADLKVYVGGDAYTPYKTFVANKLEYLVILPVGAQNPEIRLTTTGGARYIQPLGVASTQTNVCYCINLRGINLLLENFIIADWAYGEAISGQYSSVTSFPAFLGDPGTLANIYYDNGWNQLLLFNSRGECTIKPLGRRIIRIKSGSKDFMTNPPIILRSMLIDLKPHIDNET